MTIVSSHRALARDRGSVEVAILWGHAVLCVRHIEVPGTFTVGDDSARVDFVLPEELGLGAQRTLLDAKVGYVAVYDAGDQSHRLERDRPLSLDIGPLSFRFLFSDAEHARFPRAAWDVSSATYFGASVVSWLSLTGAMSAFAPPLGLTEGEELDRDRLATMLEYLNARAERERPVQSDAGAGERSQSSEGAVGAPGSMGQPISRSSAGRFASSAPAAPHDTTMTRTQALAEARSFGLIALLAGAPHPGAIWDSAGALHPFEADVMGRMFGKDIAEAAGNGGLWAMGTGLGSGGPGAGIGSSGIGTCQSLGGCKGGSGFGADHGIGRVGHTTGGAPRLRLGTTAVSGVLPGEVIQRVVRQNFGRFRSCYEGGLRGNPSLEGRVTARFVIDRTGAVSLVQNGGSDLPDSAVVGCVLSAFYGLSFPAPDHGVVRVSYPIVFSPG